MKKNRYLNVKSGRTQRKVSADYAPENLQLPGSRAQDFQLASRIIRYIQEEERF